MVLRPTNSITQIPILAAASVSGDLNSDQTSGLTNAPQITWLPLS